MKESKQNCVLFLSFTTSRRTLCIHHRSAIVSFICLFGAFTYYRQRRWDPIDRQGNHRVDAFVVFHLGYWLVQHPDRPPQQRQRLIDALQEPVWENLSWKMVNWNDLITESCETFAYRFLHQLCLRDYIWRVMASARYDWLSLTGFKNRRKTAKDDRIQSKPVKAIRSQQGPYSVIDLRIRFID